MAVRIRLARHGKKSAPFYHIVAADGRNARDGKFIEVLGTYDPRNKEKRVVAKKERVEYWVKNGATATETVAKLLKSL